MTSVFHRLSRYRRAAGEARNGNNVALASRRHVARLESRFGPRPLCSAGYRPPSGQRDAAATIEARSDGVFPIGFHVYKSEVSALVLWFDGNDVLIALRAYFQLHGLAAIVALTFQFSGV